MSRRRRRGRILYWSQQKEEKPDFTHAIGEAALDSLSGHSGIWQLAQGHLKPPGSSSFSSLHLGVMLSVELKPYLEEAFSPQSRVGRSWKHLAVYYHAQGHFNTIPKFPQHLSCYQLILQSQKELQTQNSNEQVRLEPMTLPSRKRGFFQPRWDSNP